MWNVDRLKKAWNAIEQSINIIGAVASAIGIVIMLVVAMTGHWDWRTAFFVLMIISLVCICVAFYGYRSRVAVHMFTGVSKAERMCQADQYAAKRIAEAQRSVWDFAWQDDKESNPKTDPPAAVRSAGSKALDEAIRGAIAGGLVHYHEILTTKAYSPLLRKHIGYCREITPDRTLKYRARIYDNTRKGYRKFPKIQFVVIDEEEVIFMSSGYEYCFSMKSKKTASVFLKYALMAWEQADEWKKGVKDVVLDSNVVPDFEDYLQEIPSRINQGKGAKEI
jgi:hypothetical protein